MAFVMVSTGSLTRSGVRTLSVRSIALGFALIAFALLAGGGFLGYLLARPAAAPVLRAATPGSNPYTVEQLGTIAGRVFKLENEAAHLGRKIGVLQDYEAQTRGKKGGSGGPMLAPRLGAGASDPVAELNASLGRVEQTLTQIGQATAQKNLAYMSFPSRAPIPGADTGSLFGNRTDPITRRLAFHGGIDFVAETGTPIHSAAGGKVIFAAYHPEFGWMVEIDHGNGLVTRYAHASKLLVKQGAVVVPQEKIALSGSTGRSTGPHLHFEVLRDGEYADPQNYLAGR